MAYTNGTASNYKDLLARLITFAAANGHTVLEQSETACYMKGVGLNGLDEIYWGISTSEDASNSRYNWELVGSIGYRSGRANNAHPGSNGGGTYIYLWNASIPYWMVANARRIILVAKVGTVYEVCYIGFGTPTGTEAQYPYPLVVGGCGYSSDQNYSLSSAAHAAFCGWNASGSNSFGRLYLPGGGWLMTQSASYNHSDRVSACYQVRASILTSPDGEYLLDEIYLRGIISIHTGNSVWLACRLDGLYLISGYENAAENIITVDGVNYLVFPDVYRSSYGDYFALRLN